MVSFRPKPAMLHILALITLDISKGKLEMAGINLTDLTANLSSFMPSGSSILQSVAESAAVGVVVAGLKSQLGNGALDPLGLIPLATGLSAKTPAAPAAAVANNPAVSSSATITASAFASLPATAQAMLTASGVHIIAG
jgi:hypothetical protein